MVENNYFCLTAMLFGNINSTHSQIQYYK